MQMGFSRTSWGLLVLVGVVLWSLGGPGVGRAGERSLLNEIEEEISAILETNRPSVVRIHTIHSRPKEGNGLQLGKGFTHGTGFFFDGQGHILTVEEAVRDAEKITITLASGLQTKAVFVASDPASEVAVLRVDADSLPPVRLGDSDRAQVGHYAFILGNTFGNLSPSFGSVHEINRDGNLIQVVATVRPGYGGAPVFCSTGEVLGMVWAALDPGAALRQRAAQDGVSSFMTGWQELPTTVFVIPINRAVRIARALIAEREMVYGWLGMEGEDDPEQGVRITDISPRGPAENGVRRGDLILSYQGRRIRGVEHLKLLVLATPPGTRASMEIKRGNTQLTARIEVGRMAPEFFAEAIAAMSPADTRGFTRELNGIRQMLQQSDASGPFPSQDASAPPSAGNRHAMERRIDKLEMELWRLKELLQGK